MITTYNCCSTAALHNSLDLPGRRAVGTDGGGTLAPSDLYRSVNLIGGQIIIALQIFRFSYGPTGLEPHDRVMESKKT